MEVYQPMLETISKCPNCGMLLLPPQQMLLSSGKSVICRDCGNSISIKPNAKKQPEVKIERSKISHACVDQCIHFTLGVCSNSNATIQLKKVIINDKGEKTEVPNGTAKLCGLTVDKLPKEGCSLLATTTKDVKR